MKTLARDRDTQALLRRLRNLRPDSSRQWGRMTAHQMVCHLTDSTRVALGDKTVSAASGILSRTLIKWMALYVPLRWPPGIQTRPEIEQGLGGTCPRDFAADVAELEAILQLMAARAGGFVPVHPIFGRMSDRAWLRWAYLHTDHHFRQFGV